MSDADTTNEGTAYHEKADGPRKRSAPEYDAWDRQRVDPNDPRFVEANRNRVNSGDFGVVSAELVASGDGPEKVVPQPEDAPAEGDD